MKNLKTKTKWEEKNGVIYVQFRKPITPIITEEFNDSKTILEPKRDWDLDPELEFDSWYGDQGPTKK